MEVCTAPKKAFAVHVSQETNTRLRILAELIVAGFGQCETGTNLRTQFDHLLLTAHEGARRPV